jgi:hypothetical protein
MIKSQSETCDNMVCIINMWINGDRVADGRVVCESVKDYILLLHLLVNERSLPLAATMYFHQVTRPHEDDKVIEVLQG